MLFSSAENAVRTGDYIHNGGVKLYNLWVKLLRQHGYSAFLVTYDGEYQPWLIEHQPHVSIETVRRWRDAGLPLRFVTGWLSANPFIELADALYFYDAELAYTSGPHFRRLKQLLKRRLRAVATHSRTQQAWYMAVFGREVPLIPIWSDEAYWRPAPERRVSGRVGYMVESPSSRREIELISRRCSEAGVSPSFVEVAGDEREVLAELRQCDIFLGMNHGKDPFWGEGSPLTQQEAMHAGAVVVAYDVFGNREYLIDGYNGFLVRRGEPELLADKVVALLADVELKERLRRNAIGVASEAFGSSTRWEAVRDFLELEDLPLPDSNGVADAFDDRATVESLIGAPVYLGEEEVPVFARKAAQAHGTLVEIGAGYGSSSFVLGVCAPPDADVVSVDPFVADSMSGFQVTPWACWRNVHRAAEALGLTRRLGRWTLLLEPSASVAGRWSRPVSFLYIDGNHHYEAVRRDYESWAPFVEPGGTIVLHDSRRLPDGPEGDFARGWPGPTRLADELRTHSCVELTDEVFSMTFWRRTSEECAACRSWEAA